MLLAVPEMSSGFREHQPQFFVTGIGGCVALKELHCNNCTKLQSLGGAKLACSDSAHECCLERFVELT